VFGHGEFSDIGTPAAYLEENLRWLRRSALESTRFIHASAHVSRDVDIIDSVIGAGATVQGSGRLERVVVWPGATATAPLSDAVVTPRYGVFFVST
jgi:NDP-sugar pyrophosphorylase family protein